MAAEMQRELESTRNELRRGVFELPQETAESAAQMRRVIVDQIEALAELNRIVARHGRNLDAVEPVLHRTREEPTLAVVGGRSEPPRAPADIPRSEMPPPSRRVRRSEARAAALPRLPAAHRRNRPRSPPPRQTRAAAGFRTYSIAPHAKSQCAMFRASRPAKRRVTSCANSPGRARIGRRATPSSRSNSLSVDIARMIDHDAAADLWDRYKRGERNVFTRRLYTLQGQQAFDDIRKKYRADREFKQTVDRYISEFERLLEEVSRDDRGQVVARTYLTSETGKVYTMLAHAAGRFD